MSAHAELAEPRLQSIVAGLAYLKPPRERPYSYAYEPPAGTPWENCEYELHAARIADARTASSPLSVHVEGFELRDAPTAVSNFLDEGELVRTYYAEAAELALAVTGAARAYVFDHLVRKREAGRPALTFGRRVPGDKPAANGRIHNDYTEASGPKRMAAVLEDGAEVRAIGRYAIVNIWRSIRGPVLDTPLAVCDARSVAPRDLVTGEVRYATRTGEIYLLTHSPSHRWHYFPAMDRDEALVFKQYDSGADVARFVPHAAFDHPHAPADAPLRESIEVRCLVVY